MSDPPLPLIPRSASQAVSEALLDTPVVAINGARQVGKSTLAADVTADRFDSVTLDDRIQRIAAAADPTAFVEDRSRGLVIDEVQRVPDLLLAIKATVDRDRRPGRFLLTGSTRLLSTPRISESLAGRIEIIDLWPLCQGEIGRRREGFVDALMEWRPTLRIDSDLRRGDYFERACVGGFPEAIVRTGRRREAWFTNYIATVVELLVEDVADIERVGAMPQLIRLAAARTGTELNVSSIARDLGIRAQTLAGYLNHLQTVFVIQLIPSWSRNLSSKVVRRPKLMMVDSGLAAHLLGVDADRLAAPDSPAGQLLESFVGMEIRKQLGWSTTRPAMSHFRDRDGAEVDIVLETRDGRVAGVEVKAASTLASGDLAGLRLLERKLGPQFAGGVVLYTGRWYVPFGPKIAALPIEALWAV